MTNLNVETLFGTVIVSSSVFSNLEENEALVAGPSIDIYDTFFIKCNVISHVYSVITTNELFMNNVVFKGSSGALTQNNTKTSKIRIQSIMAVDTKSERCILLNLANIEISQVNFSNNICVSPYWTGSGPQYLNSRFVSLMSNECEICANLEAEINCIAINSHIQFVRNKCSNCLLSSYRADCHCDWFYFTNNNETSCKHNGNGTFHFTNSFTTSSMICKQGYINGIISIDVKLTDLPFPAVMKRNPGSGKVNRTDMMIVLLFSINLLLF